MTDRQEAERFLRDRLDARDEGKLSVFLANKNLTFGEWADWFLEKRSQPPFRFAVDHADPGADVVDRRSPAPHDALHHALPRAVLHRRKDRKHDAIRRHLCRDPDCVRGD